MFFSNTSRAAKVALTILAATFLFLSAGTADEQSRLRVQFGSIALPAFGAPFYAQQTGAYEKAGLRVDIQAGRLSQDAVNAVIAGTSDIAFALAINVILSADKGQRVVAVGNFYGKNGFGLIAAKDKGIDKITDLAGHSVLVPGGSYEALIRALITRQGGDPSKTKFILVPQPAAMLNSYVGKQADAVLTVIPFGYSGVEASRPSVYIPFADIGDPEPLYVWVVRPDVLAKRGDEIRRFLKVTYTAMGEINRDPDVLIAPFVKAVPGAQADKVVVDYKPWLEFECADGESIVGQPSARSWSAAVQLYKDVGLIGPALKAEELFTAAMFEGANSVSSLLCPR